MNKKLNSRNVSYYSTKWKLSLFEQDDKIYASDERKFSCIHEKKVEEIEKNSKPSSDKYLIPLGGNDNLGEAFKYDIEIDNICVIGNDEDVFGLVVYITSYFERCGHHLELVTPEQFLRLGKLNNFRTQHYLVYIDPSKISGNRVGIITDYCSATFISRFSPVFSILNRVKYNRILMGLNRNYSIRQAMLNSLKQDESLVINKDDQKILSLKIEV